MGYQYKICYKKGDTNKAANALSRATHTDSVLSAISVAQLVWFRSLQDSYKDNQDAQELLSTLAIQSPQGHYSLQQGVIRYKSTIWLGHSEELQNKVLH
jgi:hypothetical protein